MSTYVIKIGTSSLTQSNGSISTAKIAEIVRQVAQLKKQEHRVVIVTSGSIAAGFRKLGYAERPCTVPRKQAAAAAGQGLLMEEYTKQLSAFGYTGAQVLLTRDDFTDKRRYNNIFNSLEELLHCGAVPIINENDTISIEELRFGDNDTLSAQVAALIHADLLILLTDIDGLYTEDPRKNPQAERIAVVEKITPELLAAAGGAASALSTGGMHSKLTAATLATLSGVPVYICSSDSKNAILGAVQQNNPGTFFKATDSNLKTRLQWMAFYTEEKGRIYIDKGAVKALVQDGNSLLPSGVVAVEGHFRTGEVIGVYSSENVFLGRGVTAYDTDALMQIKGQHNTKTRHKPVIHRDNWVDGAFISIYRQEANI